jgi:hypothetical protein
VFRQLISASSPQPVISAMICMSRSRWSAAARPHVLAHARRVAAKRASSMGLSR